MENVRPQLGQIIENRYKLTRVLGEGGMGIVYLAEDVRLRGRLVAIKLLHGEIARDREYVARFRGEAARAASINCPRVVRILDLGETGDGAPFLVMEYVRGQTLTS